MINKGVILSNLTQSKEKTIVIMGVARSGTTMTAKVVEELGVDMGSDTGGYVNERRDVFELLENNKLKEFDQFVARQNNQFPLWGWKRPKSMEYVDLFEHRIRNPHYIIPFRDYVSIALRNNMAIDLDPKKNIIDTHVKRYSQVIQFVQTNKHPMLLFSYEKANMYPHYFVNQVAKFLGITDQEKIKTAAQSINAKANPYINQNSNLGSLDKVSKGKIHGWAKKINSAKPMTLKVLVNQKEVTKVIANKPRKDLSHIGNYAFTGSIEDHNLIVGNTYKIAVVDLYGNHIKNSPKTYVHE